MINKTFIFTKVILYLGEVRFHKGCVVRRSGSSWLFFTPLLGTPVNHIHSVRGKQTLSTWMRTPVSCWPWGREGEELRLCWHSIVELWRDVEELAEFTPGLRVDSSRAPLCHFVCSLCRPNLTGVRQRMRVKNVRKSLYSAEKNCEFFVHLPAFSFFFNSM